MLQCSMILMNLSKALIKAVKGASWTRHSNGSNNGFFLRLRLRPSFVPKVARIDLGDIF